GGGGAAAGGGERPAEVDGRGGGGAGGQGRRGGGGVERERARVHVGEDRPGPRLQHRGRGRVERVRRDDHLTPADPEGEQGDGEAGAGARDGHGMRPAP